MAAPTTYEVDGTQYVVLVEGYGGGAIGLPFPPGFAGSRCHVFGAGVLPDLRRLPAGIHSMFADIVLRGRSSSLGMGRFDDVLTDQDVSNIHAYLLSEGTK